ncbi:MAG: C25 family cysteine peptidase [Candidatus Fermentibacter sp.]|nr:C25 family cysteine peptidase [Candidatus Fermentibacter sp.]
MDVAAIAALILSILSQPADPYSTAVQTMNPDPDWVDPTPWEFAAQTGAYEPFRVTPVPGADESPEMVILLEEGLTQQIGTELVQQWMDDIQAEEYSVQALEISYGTPEEIKGLLDSLYDLGLEGAVLVGNLPAAWTAVWDTEAHLGEKCPTDYFLMDLDGEWLDLWVNFPRDSVAGQDGYYDTFLGSLDPEIWVGRIRVDNLSALGDPVAMLQAYLQRNHQWRTTGDPPPARALCYVDDDWQAMGDIYQAALELLYEDVDLFSRSPETCERDYEEFRLPDTYQWVSPFVHSSPNNHFWMPAGGTTNWSEIVPIAPPARFYNLFACSNCRFTTTNNMGSIYAVAAQNGLAAVGSTTSGAMLQFNYFYGPLGGGGSLGEAWKLWWDRIALNGLSQVELNWHIGMALLGDPSLVPSMFLTGIGGQEGAGAFMLSVAPSPSTGPATVTVLNSPGQGTSVDVFDTSGRLVRRTVLDGCGAEACVQIDIDIPGVYLVRASSGGQTEVRRLVVIE